MRNATAARDLGTGLSSGSRLLRLWMSVSCTRRRSGRTATAEKSQQHFPFLLWVDHLAIVTLICTRHAGTGGCGDEDYAPTDSAARGASLGRDRVDHRTLRLICGR